jgi:hypothetical protein
VVQSAGQAFQLKAQQLMDEFKRNGPVLHLLHLRMLRGRAAGI